jgi:hypothetical protein
VGDHAWVTGDIRSSASNQTSMPSERKT